MVNLLRSEWLVELNKTTIDVGLEEQTPMNPWLCVMCWRHYPDCAMDLESGLCIRCAPVDGGEGEESEDELDDKIHLMD